MHALVPFFANNNGEQRLSKEADAFDQPALNLLFHPSPVPFWIILVVGVCNTPQASQRRGERQGPTILRGTQTLLRPPLVHPEVKGHLTAHGWLALLSFNSSIRLSSTSAIPPPVTRDLRLDTDAAGSRATCADIVPHVSFGTATCCLHNLCFLCLSRDHSLGERNVAVLTRISRPFAATGDVVDSIRVRKYSGLAIEHGQPT